MNLGKQVESLFRPLIGQKAWGASIGWGSFVTVEFGPKHLSNHHYHGEWHLWLYQCDWHLYAGQRLLANSESKKRIMQIATENLNGKAFERASFDEQRMATEFAFGEDLRLVSQPYDDATTDEECWMLFRPDQQVVSLRKSGLHSESQSSKPEKSLVRR
jgi:hypothetical protein